MNMKAKTLNHYPLIQRPSSVMALAADVNGLWVGGLGGAAHYGAAGWRPANATAPVAALAASGATLLAGGSGIALSRDEGQTWLRAEFQGDPPAVTTLALSPNFAHDNIALAGSVSAGIFRSDDGGARWQEANFGVPSLELTSLLWLSETVVLAATSGGVCRSPNAGRAWKVCAGTEGGPIAALTVLDDGTVLAGVELGGVLRSPDGGQTWARHGDLPPDVQILSLFSVGRRVLMGTANYGLAISSDGGAAWDSVVDAAVWCFAADSARIYAGTDIGILVSDDGGQTWDTFPMPPLHDLRHILIADNSVMVYGTHTPPMLYDAAGTWRELASAPLPLTALVAMPDGALLASSDRGLARSNDGGASWLSALAGPAGRVHLISVQADGLGYAASSAGAPLLRTRDYGLSWEMIASPFGVLPLAALQALQRPFGQPGAVAAATYDARRQVVQFWRSEDEGATWARGAEIRTSWPLVCTLASPLLMTVGGDVFLEQPGGSWAQRKAGEGAIRRIVGDSTFLVALTTSAFYVSQDGGWNWHPMNLGIAPSETIDLAVESGELYVLMAGGRLASCAISDLETAKGQA